MKEISLSEILEGKDKCHQFEIKELGGYINLYPLTGSQWNNVEQKQLTSMKMKGKKSDPDPEMEFEVADIKRNEFEGEVLAIYYSMVVNAGNDKYKIEDIKKLKAGLISKIAKKVYEISGVTVERLDEARSFREDEKRTGDSDTSPVKRATGKKTK